MSRTPIAFFVQEPVADPIAEEEDKLKARAEKFGTTYKEGDATKVKFGAIRDNIRQAKLTAKEGFQTGFDLFTPEEVAKREERSKRFGTAVDGAVTPTIRIAGPTEEDKLRQERAERFGLEYEPDPTGLKGINLFEEPKEVSDDTERRHDAIHVYGVDIMSTKDIKQYFSDYCPSYVEWINDSSCNVCFSDSYTACRAIISLGEVLTKGETTPDGVAAMTETDVSQLAFLWHRSHEPFVVGSVGVPLMFRIATVADVKDFAKRRKSRNLWTLSKKHADAVVHDAVVPDKRNNERHERKKRDREVDADGDTHMANDDEDEAGGDDAGPSRYKKKKKKKARGERDRTPFESERVFRNRPVMHPSFQHDDRDQADMQAEPTAASAESHSFFLNEGADQAIAVKLEFIEEEDVQLVGFDAGTKAEM